jgi:hypothetical protein
MSDPGYLSGMSPTEVAHTGDLWAQRKYPDEVKRLAYLEGLETHLRRAGQLLIGYQRQCADQRIVLAVKKSRAAATAVIAAAGAVTQ